MDKVSSRLICELSYQSATRKFYTLCRFAIQIFVLTDFAPLPLLEMQVLGMGRRDMRQVAQQTKATRSSWASGRFRAAAIEEETATSQQNRADMTVIRYSLLTIALACMWIASRV
jgi:hypothetical protein